MARWGRSRPIQATIRGRRVAAVAVTTNDDFANAVAVDIATNGGTYTSPAVNTTGFAEEAGEPTISASKDRSAWWKYTPTSSGTATFDTQLSTTLGQGTDTVMAIWTGTALANLVNVASDDDGGGATTSLISGLAVTAGTTYWIQVGGYGLQAMNVVVRVTGPATTAAAPSWAGWGIPI